AAGGFSPVREASSSTAGRFYDAPSFGSLSPQLARPLPAPPPSHTDDPASPDQLELFESVDGEGSGMEYSPYSASGESGDWGQRLASM
ncbi:hypothetical protein TeGR_g2577, partial [Tetraparma gracilis]